MPFGEPLLQMLKPVLPHRLQAWMLNECLSWSHRTKTSSASLTAFDSMEQDACSCSEVLGRRSYFYSDSSHITLGSTRDNIFIMDLYSIGGTYIFLTFCIFKSRHRFLCCPPVCMKKRETFLEFIWTKYLTLSEWEQNLNKHFYYCKRKFDKVFLSTLTVKVTKTSAVRVDVLRSNAYESDFI